MSTIHILYLGNNTIVDLTGLRNEYTGAYVVDATVNVTLLDPTGQEVSGSTWPQSMEFLADSNGIYRATLPYSLTLAEGGRYIARIVADDGNGLRAEWDLPCVGRTRT